MELRAKERQYLLDCALFRGVPQEELLALPKREGCSLRSFERGEVIYGGETFSRCLCLLLSGSAAVSKRTDDGRGLAISTLQAGMLFGAAAIFNEAEAFTNVITASEPCRVLAMEQSCFLGIMQAHFSVAEAYIRYLSDRILFLNERIAALVAGSADQRVAHFLLQNGPEIRLSMTELASRLNIGRASLYRVMDRFQASGAIARSGKTITVCCPELLEAAGAAEKGNTQ